MSDIAVQKKITAYEATEAVLGELETRLKGKSYEIQTKAGLEAAKKDRAEVKSIRVALEKARVQEKAESLAYGKFVDAEAKRITARLTAIEDPTDSLIKDEEARLQEIIDKPIREAAAAKAAAEEAEKVRVAEELKKAQEEVAAKEKEIADREAALKAREEALAPVLPTAPLAFPTQSANVYIAPSQPCFTGQAVARPVTDEGDDALMAWWNRYGNAFKYKTISDAISAYFTKDDTP